MKKTFLALSVIALIGLGSTAHAAGGTCDPSTPGVKFQANTVNGGGVWICPDGTTADANGACGPSNGGNYACPAGMTCRVSGSVGACVPLPAGMCGPSKGGDYSCPSGQTCRVQGDVGTCVSLATDSVSTPASGSGAPSGYVPVVTIPGLTDAKSTLVVNQGTLANFLNNLYKYLIGIAAILAVIEIIWGGILISIQRDSISMHAEGVQKIRNALGGLALVLLPALVFSIINPGILNLSVNIPALDIHAETYNPYAASNQLASTTVTFYNSGLTTQSAPSSCNGTNCTGAYNACMGVNGLAGQGSGAELVCWNPSTKKEEGVGSGTKSWDNVICPASDVPGVRCTIVSQQQY